MTARKEIKKDEEVTFDYGTSEANVTKGITDCCCGENNCRKTLTSEDWKIKELRGYFFFNLTSDLYKGHFHSHLQKLIDNE
jgi:hypothetical protein